MNHRAPVNRAPITKAAKAIPTTVGVSNMNNVPGQKERRISLTVFKNPWNQSVWHQKHPQSSLNCGNNTVWLLRLTIVRKFTWTLGWFSGRSNCRIKNDQVLKYCMLFITELHQSKHNTVHWDSACQPQTTLVLGGSCSVLISYSLRNVIQKPETGKHRQSSYSVSGQCPKGWPVPLSHLFQAIWNAFRKWN